MNINILEREVKLKNKINSIQEWIKIEKIFNNGIIKTKNNKYIKIIKIIPVNYYLKSELEKEVILNSYKNFLKVCNFNIQILIQSQKEDLSLHCSSVKIQSKKENKKIIQISEKYLNYIQEINYSQKSSTKNFYILISTTKDKNNLIIEENIFFDELKDKYFIIKENLSRCGNIVINISNKKEIKNILYSFFNKNMKKPGGEFI